MLKKYKWTLVLTSLVILLPIAAGLVLWSRLPAQIPVHFDVHSQPDSYAPKVVAVFAMPGLMLVLHWVCVLATSLDPKRKNIPEQYFTLLLWLVPAISLVVNALCYSMALGYSIRVTFIVTLLIGALFLLLGNFLPKCQPNYVVGFKLPWTLDDPENWQKTHRVAGWTMSLAGLAILISAWWDNIWLLLAITLTAILIPILYSLIFYLRKRK